jgi:16S rRNA (guanine(1405)-N(7))-methyltransferase
MGKRQEISLEEILRVVSNSKRYRWVSEDVVARLAAEEIPKSRNQGDAEKRTKKRLHQIFGAYATPLQYERTLGALKAAREEGDEELFRDLCARAMSQHASTKERLPFVADFYAEVFKLTGPPSVLMDVACGLGPLAVPWMGLAPDCTYIAYDIDRQLRSFVGRFLDLVGLKHTAGVRDVIVSPPTEAADVALILKTISCLERQSAIAGRQLLEAVNARKLVVSYPTRSLGGRGKGMGKNYRLQFAPIVEEYGWEAEEIEFPNEVVFVVTKSG